MAEKRSIRELRKHKKSISGSIALRAWSGSNLVEKNKFSGKSDPYLIFTLIQGNSKTEIKKTEVVHNTIDPRWEHEVFTVQVDDNFPENSMLLVECLDWEKIGKHKHMGQVLINIDALEHDECEGVSTVTENYPIQPHKENAEVYGSLQLTVSYTNSQCWKDDKEKRLAQKKQREEKQKEDERLSEIKKKEDEEARAKQILEVQKKSVEDLKKRLDSGEEDIWRKGAEKAERMEEERLREEDYPAYVKLCKSKGKTPLSEISQFPYENPWSKYDGTEVVKPWSEIMADLHSPRSHDYDFLDVKK